MPIHSVGRFVSLQSLSGLLRNWGFGTEDMGDVGFVTIDWSSSQMENGRLFENVIALPAEVEGRDARYFRQELRARIGWRRRMKKEFSGDNADEFAEFHDEEGKLNYAAIPDDENPVKKKDYLRVVNRANPRMYTSHF